MNLIAKLLPSTNILLDTQVTSKKRVFEQAGLVFENNQGIAHSKSKNATRSSVRWSPFPAHGFAVLMKTT